MESGRAHRGRADGKHWRSSVREQPIRDATIDVAKAPVRALPIARQRALPVDDTKDPDLDPDFDPDRLRGHRRAGGSNRGAVARAQTGTASRACTARSLAAVSRRVKVKIAVFAACRVRCLRCTAERLPSVAELQDLLPSRVQAQGERYAGLDPSQRTAPTPRRGAVAAVTAASRYAEAQPGGGLVVNHDRGLCGRRRYAAWQLRLRNQTRH